MANNITMLDVFRSMHSMNVEHVRQLFVNDFKQIISEKDEIIRNLQTQLHASNGENSFNSDNDSFNCEKLAQNIENSMETYQNKFNCLESNPNKDKEVIDRPNARIESINELLATEKQNFNDLQQQYDMIVEQKSKIESENKDLKNTMETNQNTIQCLESKYNAAINELRKKENEVRILSEENAKLKNNNAMESNANRDKHTIDRLNARIKSIKALLVTDKQNFNQLQQQYDLIVDQKSKIEKVNRSYKQLSTKNNKKLSKMSENLDNQRKTIENLENKLLDKRAMITTLMNKNNVRINRKHCPSLSKSNQLVLSNTVVNIDANNTTSTATQSIARQITNSHNSIHINLLSLDYNHCDDYDSTTSIDSDNTVTSIDPYLNNTVICDDFELNHRNDRIKMKSFKKDLERVRLILELICKREKQKREFLAIHQNIIELQLNPYKAFLLNVLSLLEEKDTNNFFAKLDDNSQTIRNPMDFNTIRLNINDNKYLTYDAFEADFELIIKNSIFYYEKHAILNRYYTAANKLREQTVDILKDGRRKSKLYNTKTGLHKPLSVNDLVVSTINKNQSVAISGYKSKRSGIKRRSNRRRKERPKQYNDSLLDFRGILPQTKSYRKRNVYDLNSDLNDVRSDSTSFETSAQSTESDTSMTADSNTVSSKSYDSMLTASEESNTTNSLSYYSAHSDNSYEKEYWIEEPLEHNDVVWAKRTGYRWYPAVIVNPEIAKQPSNIDINRIPPEDVLAKRPTNDSNQYFLVSLFDAKRSWCWLRRRRLDILLDEDLKINANVVKPVKKRRIAMKNAFKRVIEFKEFLKNNMAISKVN